MQRLVVVGGHTRNIGKTQLAVEIIRAFPEARWLAAKITQYGHGICSVNGAHCGCADNEHTVAVDRETDENGRSDTSRMLAAGADLVFWVRTKQGRLAEAMPRLREEMGKADNVILESNTVLGFLKPDLYLPVLDFSREDFKDSARQMLDRADAYVVTGGTSEPPDWDRVSLRWLRERPVFRAQPDELCSPALVEFIRERLFSS